VCAGYGLDETETMRVDEKIAYTLGHMGWARVLHHLRAEIMNVAPGKVAAVAAQHKANRYVRKYETDDPASARLDACIDTADAIFFDAALDRLADILQDQGDISDKQHRRAKAVGILAVPALALSMMGAPTRRGLPDDAVIPEVTAKDAAKALPVAQVYVHIDQNVLAQGDGVVRVERLGPAMLTQLSNILGHSRVKLTPVIQVGGQPSVDSHEIPDRIREAVILRDGYEPFLYSTREARHNDMDHIKPFQPGQPGQTSVDNLAPLSRRVHRAKTHCNWTYEQIEPGVFEWITEYGQHFIVGPDGTTNLNRDGPPK